MRMHIKLTLITTILSAAVALQAGEADNRRLEEANGMFKEIMDTPDRAIPRDLLRNSQCMVLVPGLKKAGFIVAAKFGRGFVLCRAPGGWSAPVAVRVEGGSVGFQIGASETDIILLVRSKSGM